MHITSDSRRLAWVARLWVAAQFGLIAGLLLWPAHWSWNVGASALLLAALALGVSALRANPPGNFNIRPLPKEGSRLIGSGPYRWIRHPMYSALLLAAAAALAAAPTQAHLLLALALALVLHGKAALEERLLRQRWPQYAAYCRSSRRFIPWLW